MRTRLFSSSPDTSLVGIKPISVRYQRRDEFARKRACFYQGSKSFRGVSQVRMSPSVTNTNGDSSNGPPHATYGFIGIGVMGYGMAANLRAKIPKSSKLIICEVNKARREQFFAENKGLLEVAHSPREVAEQAVGHLPLPITQGLGQLLSDFRDRTSSSQCCPRASMSLMFLPILRMASSLCQTTTQRSSFSSALQLRRRLPCR